MAIWKQNDKPSTASVTLRAFQHQLRYVIVWTLLLSEIDSLS